MLGKKIVASFYIGIVALVFMLLGGCDTGVEISQDPGILRVTLQSDPSDTTIAIADTAYTVSQGDRFNVRISEGKAYRQESFFILFKDTLTYNQEDLIFNIIRLEDGAYKKYIVFETLLPAGNYDRLQFSLMSNRLSNGEPDKLKVGNFEATVVLPLDENNLMDFHESFRISENELTEINLWIKPFESVVRFQDIFFFDRKVDVVSIN